MRGKGMLQGGESGPATPPQAFVSSSPTSQGQCQEFTEKTDNQEAKTR